MANVQVRISTRPRSIILIAVCDTYHDVLEQFISNHDLPSPKYNFFFLIIRLYTFAQMFCNVLYFFNKIGILSVDQLG